MYLVYSGPLEFVVLEDFPEKFLYKLHGCGSSDVDQVSFSGFVTIQVLTYEDQE